MLPDSCLFEESDGVIADEEMHEESSPDSKCPSVYDLIEAVSAHKKPRVRNAGCPKE